MSAKARRALVPVFAGLAIIAVWLLAFSIMNVEECPDGYTQEQVDESGCNIGANIGGGLALMAMVPVTFTITFFTWQYVQKLKQESPATDIDSST